MSIRNAGAAIREAREKAGLSREKLSDGICSVQSLYRIETGKAGVSPSTFHALMAHAGAPCEVLPVFANRDDFDCFLAPRHVRLHLDAWQQGAAYAELENVERKHWADNKYYYQEWLLHHCRLQFRSGKADHQAVRKLILEALHISLPDADLSNIAGLLLTVNEIELLILLAQESLYLSDCAGCLLLCRQLSAYISQSKLSEPEKNQLAGALSVVEVKGLIAAEEYQAALEHAKIARDQIIYHFVDSSLLEITFLTGLCYYYNHDTESAFDLFETAIVSAHALKSNYAAICIDYIKYITTGSIPEEIQSLEPIVSPSFSMPVYTDELSLSDGTYDIFSADVLTFGALVHMLRTEQKISQNTLCLGLCSKSKLSKIENGTLQPDLLLAEALLQRLGISEREFSFWGNAQEEQLSHLKFELIYSSNLPLSEQRAILNQLKELSDNNDVLTEQLYLFNYATLPDPSIDKQKLSEAALSCTLPDFDISQIHNYRLSWSELSILNNLALTYKGTLQDYIGIAHFYQLDSYYRSNNLDLLLLIHTHAVMLPLMMHSLYSAGRYNEAVDYFETHPYDILIYTPNLYTSALFYLCQCYGECKQNEKACQYGRYTYYLEKLIANEIDAISIKNSLLNDFGIKL